MVKKFITSNILGVFNLLEAFRRFVEKNKKSKLIHVSTDEVYGDVIRLVDQKKTTHTNQAHLMLQQKLLQTIWSTLI